MGSKPVEDIIESSSGVHFSGFHLNGLQKINTKVEQQTASLAESVHRQPFVIGNCYTSVLVQYLYCLLIFGR